MKEMNFQDGRAVPNLSLSVGDLDVINAVLTGYMGYLQRSVVPAGKQGKHGALLQALQELRLRIVRARYEQSRGSAESGESAVLLILTYGDVEVLDRAFAGFIEVVGRTVAPSPERDSTLQSLRDFRGELARMRYRPRVD